MAVLTIELEPLDPTGLKLLDGIEAVPFRSQNLTASQEVMGFIITAAIPLAKVLEPFVKYYFEHKSKMTIKYKGFEASGYSVSEVAKILEQIDEASDK